MCVALKARRARRRPCVLAAGGGPGPTAKARTYLAIPAYTFAHVRMRKKSRDLNAARACVYSIQRMRILQGGAAGLYTTNRSDHMAEGGQLQRVICCIMLVACAAPAVDETLKSDDVAGILDQLVEAQNHSYVLGLKLLPSHKVEAIHRQYQDPEERLLHILLAFTKQIQPRPTWSVIIEALKAPAVNLPSLARRVEADHFPDPTSTRDVVPKTTTGMLPSARFIFFS